MSVVIVSSSYPSDTGSCEPYVTATVVRPLIPGERMYDQDRGFEVTVNSVTCPICGIHVDHAEIEVRGAYFTRIGGDSGNGYEPIHRECLD